MTTEATDPCTAASAPRLTLVAVLRRACWTGVSLSVDVDAEEDCSGTIKGVKDWITACDTAVAMPWTKFELGAAMDGKVDVKIDVPADVAPDVKVEATCPLRPRLPRGASGPGVRATFFERDVGGMILWGNKLKTKQNRQQAKQGETRS